MTTTPNQSPLPERIYAHVSPLSVGGVPLFDAGNRVTAETVPNFYSEMAIIERAVERLRQAGFDILQVSHATINIAGTPAMYERAFNARLYAEEREVIKSLGATEMAGFVDSPTHEMPGLISTAQTSMADVIEGVALEEPRYYMAPSAFAPLESYWHLRMPGDVSLACNADRAHRAGITGKGIKVAMVDSGWYQHPYFVERGYRAAPVILGPGAVNAATDEVGHGTGESANIFAVAPDVELTPVKMSFVNSTASFNAAVGAAPHIITCSWGSSNQFGPLSAADQVLAAAIASAVASGIVVVFSAGNGHWGFPGQHPDVISAGGVFMAQDGSLNASDYASGFMSNIYSNRRVPDLSGLVGMRPRAIYIMLPLEPGDQIDVGNAGGTYPNGDQTATNDGWAAFSGTSAAAPQLAGAAALVKQTCGKLTPAQVRDVLMKSARDVTAGACNISTGGNPATVGPDTATGNGLVDARKATLLARIRCMTVTPITPITPIKPIQPVEPIKPIKPIEPIKPIQPITPIKPIEPIKPIQPITPIKPIEPIEPVRPRDEAVARTAESGALLSEEDARDLEHMAIKGTLRGDELD